MRLKKADQLEESFPVKCSTLRQLTKFAGSGGGLNHLLHATPLG
ncbi:hypothetical protein ACNKHN_12865 [Shigella flexneri]